MFINFLTNVSFDAIIKCVVGIRPVSYEEGKAMATELKAAGYMECSAKTQEGLKDVFELAIRQGIASKKKANDRKLKKCSIL